jgi:hypothetical protein
LPPGGAGTALPLFALWAWNLEVRWWWTVAEQSSSGSLIFLIISTLLAGGGDDATPNFQDLK